MKPFDTFEGITVPFDRANIDTDAIIPQQFLKSIQRTGIGPNLFDEWRYLDHGEPGQDSTGRLENPDFILNQGRYRSAEILLARQNFGCGSSREHAPWALLDFGIKCIISSSFADIFYNNCFKNGMLPIILDQNKIEELVEYSDRKENIEIDLQEQEIKLGNKRIKFQIDEFKKKCLLNGLDDIAMSLEKSDKISSYEDKIKTNKPWLNQHD